MWSFSNLRFGNPITRSFEDPYSHLSTFYELIGTMEFEEKDLESVYLRLFFFSLGGTIREWLKSYLNHSLNNQGDIEEKCLNMFLLLSCFKKTKYDISTFRKEPDEPLCEA